MNEADDALRSCIEQLLHFRDEKERLVIEAANEISSEQKRTYDLKQKFEDANKQFEKVIAENYNLRNTVDSKEKLIKELKESKADSDQKLTDAAARLEFSQKQCASLTYEVRMLQEELEIRNKERGYDLKSIHAAQKQQEESIRKIAALEAECQRLRTMVQKRLPGPAALAKMKDEVKRQGTSSFAENGTRRPRAAMQPQLGARHPVSEGYQVKLQELGDENRHLRRQLLAQKERNLQFVQSSLGSTENNHPERMVSALARLDHSRSGKQQVSQMRSRGRRITGSDIQLLVDPLEIDKLERASRPSSAPHECVDAPDADSKMVVSETVHRDLIPDDGLDVVDYTTNSSDGNESLRSLSIHEKDATQNTNLEMDFGMQQDGQKEFIETTEGQIPDVTLRNHSQVEFISKLDAELLAVNEGQGDHCQEQHLVYRETESAACDESKDKIAKEGKKLKTTSAISAAAKKLAECQETIAILSKQLHALESPANADASDKEKCGNSSTYVANLVAEADPKPEGLSPSPSEGAARIKGRSEPDATEKRHEHGESGTGAKARKSGSTTIVTRPMISKSPRASVSGDARKKKKRRASLLSLLSSHGCKGS